MSNFLRGLVATKIQSFAQAEAVAEVPIYRETPARSFARGGSAITPQNRVKTAQFLQIFTNFLQFLPIFYNFLLFFNATCAFGRAVLTFFLPNNFCCNRLGYAENKLITAGYILVKKDLGFSNFCKDKCLQAQNRIRCPIT